MKKFDTIFICAHARRRHEQRADAWCDVDLRGTALEAWKSENLICQSNDRWSTRHNDGYTYVFAENNNRLILVTLYPTV